MWILAEELLLNHQEIYRQTSTINRFVAPDICVSDPSSLSDKLQDPCSGSGWDDVLLLKELGC